ncbi:hypothetical protein EDD90_2333 [Streptomyces sp. Ag109_O5-1]|uniref:hypothetical protein n=1 Tax=Streptomyces sp. Ag109_O5-1 TaxID=1938851 RepID=UPI000FB0701F|nr:hypothetical protein [Streptomyces sp. Ag109_O5-1]RPE39337.1 hypothetical protein EDD90_2333 [Streptomyces sp. Ag109_O5-1]
MAVLPAPQREVRLLTKPTGLPQPEHFGVVETPVVPPREGEVLAEQAGTRPSTVRGPSQWPEPHVVCGAV